MMVITVNSPILCLCCFSVQVLLTVIIIVGSIAAIIIADEVVFQ